jgi:outer membrane protein, heavy metal efflux system
MRYAFVVVAAITASGVGARAGAQALSLDEALRLGEEQSPRIEAQRFAVTSAQEQVGRAGELPDPKLRFGIENLPVTGADRFRYDRDFMTTRALGISQDLPNSAKRAARESRAERSRDVERAMLGSQRAMLHRDIATAWFDAYFAERARVVLERLAAQLAGQADAVNSGISRGKQSTTDAFVLRVAVEQARDKVLDQSRLVSRSRIALAALLPQDGQRPLADAPVLSRLPHSRDELLSRLHDHPHLRVYEVRQDLARAEVDVARASRRSDWSVEVGYGHRRPAFDNMLTVMLAIDLPWQADKRQDRDIASRVAEAEKARAEREEARRIHEAELRSWLADYDAATARIERYRATVIPLATDRTEAALAAYRGGRGELNAVLEAHRASTDTELSVIALEAERARAWANLSFLYPHESHR